MNRSDPNNTAMLLGQIQATLVNMQAALIKVETQMQQVAPRQELESRWKEQDRRFSDIEHDVADLRKMNESGENRVITQQSAVIMAAFSAILGAVLFYIIAHLH